MSYLIDTCVLSAIRKKQPAVLKWQASVATTEMFISVFALMEIEHGIARLKSDHHQVAVLSSWLDLVRQTFSSRTLAFDQSAASVAAHLNHPNGSITIDSMIAAIAIAHGHVVVSRNLRHFQSLVATIDPFE